MTRFEVHDKTPLFKLEWKPGDSRDVDMSQCTVDFNSRPGQVVQFGVSAKSEGKLTFYVDCESTITYKGRKIAIPSGRTDVDLYADFSADPQQDENTEVQTKKLNKDRLSRMGRSSYGPQKLHRKK